MYLLLLTMGCGPTAKDSTPPDTDPTDAGCEVCDGEDNDGDGLIDEDFADEDQDGVADCIDDDYERCDGLDNDADGLIDEGYPDSDEDGTADCQDKEECDGLDNNGDGQIDEGYPDLDGDTVADCDAESYCDGRDNDGDGRVDEGHPDTDLDGIADCVDVEECDGLDNNGDGNTDENFDDDGDGVADCLQETCNCEDDDGDGEVDEGLDCTYDVVMTASGDDALEVYFDGASAGGSAGWSALYTQTFSTTAGTHHVATHVEDRSGVVAGFNARIEVPGAAPEAYDTGSGVWRLSVTDPALTYGSGWMVGDAAGTMLSDSAYLASSTCNSRWNRNPSGAPWVWAEDCDREDVYSDNYFYVAIEVCPDAAGERCDGVDNDGDGVIDEGYVDSDFDGEADCIEEELCDGLDNNGDGTIDEDYPDSDLDGIADCEDLEECDGWDNDGDGAVDNGFPDSDGNGVADCVDEERCDGLDNNGDGTIDEGFESDVDGDGVIDCLDTEDCDGLDNDGDGEVDEGFGEDADGDGLPDACDREECDGLDNDGDGLADEDFADTDGDGKADCIDVETCDGLDNDGDGQSDEDFGDSDGDGLGDSCDTEVCDGLDNDGDGRVDEGETDTDGDGVADCVDVEDCDGIDNNGNRTIDEGFPDTDGDSIADCVDVETCNCSDDDSDGLVDEDLDCAYDVTLSASADDAFEAWFDGAAWGTGSTWATPTLLTTSVPAGDHTIAVHAEDLRAVITGFNARVSVPGELSGAWDTGLGLWTMSHTDPASLGALSWTTDGYSDLQPDNGYFASAACTDTWGWGTYGPTGGAWVWAEDCEDVRTYPDNWFFLELAVCPEAIVAVDLDGDGVDATLDCDDQDASVYPGAVEICDDDIDNDCDPTTDCSDLCAAEVEYPGECGTEVSFSGAEPLLYWDGSGLSSGRLYDSSSNGNDGTTSGTWTVEPGVVGDAGGLNGLNTYATVDPGDPAQWTVSQWVRVDAYPASDLDFMTSLGNGTTYFTGWAVVVNPSGLPGVYIEGGTSAQEEFVFDDEPVCIGAWSHVVVTWDGATVRLYRDGVEQGSNTPGYTSIPYGSLPFVAGYDRNRSSRYLDGALDEVALWDSALNGDEVAQLFTDGACGRSSW